MEMIKNSQVCCLSVVSGMKLDPSRRFLPVLKVLFIGRYLYLALELLNVFAVGMLPYKPPN
jgi:hypothetical protein